MSPSHRKPIAKSSTHSASPAVPGYFHAAVRGWFEEQFACPTAAQREAWDALEAGGHVLLAAPTGSGKTLAAFLGAIDRLIKEAEQGCLRDEVRVVYVSPLKALSNDIRRNLEAPLEEIHRRLGAARQDPAAAPAPAITAEVRSGDTSPAARTRMIKKPPHILVTTPESLYILLTSESGRAMLRTSETLIIDEIHALAATKRGAHLALSMERLQGLCAKRLTRIGLSATQEPVAVVADYLTGAGAGTSTGASTGTGTGTGIGTGTGAGTDTGTGADTDPPADKPCRIVNSGHKRRRDLCIELPAAPLEAVMSAKVWGELYDRLQQLIEAHRTTLIFVNTRRMAERMAKALSERLGEEAVTAHHGSLAKEHRLDAEQRLKSGSLRALIATAALELGIDIGAIDLVCQVGSCRGISVFLQRVGRSGHQVRAIPKGRLFPLSQDELLECAAILHAVRRGRLDQIRVYPQPLDVLAQQIVAEVAAGERTLEELYQLIRRAQPYRSLQRGQFDAVIRMLADGFSTRRGRRSAYLHLDAVHASVRPRRAARLTALTNGGAIADQFEYQVILQPEGHKIGTLHEDFSFESLPGDIFQLGNHSYRILKVEQGKVLVSDAQGQPPNIPFWFGQAPGRSDALSEEVAEMRRRIETWLPDGIATTTERVMREYALPQRAAEQLVRHLGAAFAALGALPTGDTVIFERFFDSAGDQHLVVHSTFGSRVNRAWGLALRKRFCRKFNFELQAAALEDALVLSLGSTHSFALEDVVSYLKPAVLPGLLTQALLDAPMFPTQWRWNASIALAVKRFRGGKKNPPQFQRSDAEDLVAVIFPDQIACRENLAGEREIPAHPLVEQTLYDCLHELMDVDRLQDILRRIEERRIRVLCRDLIAPSPLAEEILHAKPYAFLDDAPAEERRTSLVNSRRFLPPEDAALLGQLNGAVIEEVRREAWPEARDADECHDALLLLGALGDDEAQAHGWRPLLGQLCEQKRAAQWRSGAVLLWVAAERLPLLKGIYPEGAAHPDIGAAVQDAYLTAGYGGADGADGAQEEMSEARALLELLRLRLQCVGPLTVAQIAATLGLEGGVKPIAQALEALEGEGYAMRGHFDPAEEALQWCERGLLARIHQRTIKRLRAQVRPVNKAGLMRFLLHWQGVGAAAGEMRDGAAALGALLEQLEGAEVPGGVWESEVLPLRMRGYRGRWLDELCTGGAICWARLSPPNTTSGRLGKASLKVAPIALVQRRALKHWLAHGGRPGVRELSSNGQRVLQLLREHGAQFFDQLEERSGLLSLELEDILSALAAQGLVTSDSFAGCRALSLRGAVISTPRRHNRARYRTALNNAGRWSLSGGAEDTDAGAAGANAEAPDPWQSVAYIAQALLKRYGVVFRQLLPLAGVAPGWRELHYIYRRMEARGEVRGGRFVEGFSGEQFALPDAVGALYRIAREEDDTLVAISAADPLNLTGLICPKRTPALGKNRILLRGGVPIATLIAGQVHWLAAVAEHEQWQLQRMLISATTSQASAPQPEKYRHRRQLALP